MSNYQKTKRACYMGFITQAIAANFAPLLFLKFHNDYQIALGKIALISTCFFFTQLLVDLFCAKFVDKIGYRICIVISEVCSAAGLVIYWYRNKMLSQYNSFLNKADEILGGKQIDMRYDESLDSAISERLK